MHVEISDKTPTLHLIQKPTHSGSWIYMQTTRFISSKCVELIQENFLEEVWLEKADQERAEMQEPEVLV